MPSSSPLSPLVAAQVGAYGLAIDLDGRDPAIPGLQIIPPNLEWPTVHVRTAPAGSDRPTRHVLGDDEATVLLIEGEHIRLRRRPPQATYYLTREVDAHDLVHPYLAGAAGVFSMWFGRMAFHAGGFVRNGRVWGVLGTKDAGKTTTLAHLHLRGLPIVSDDLLVLDGVDVLTGPRCLDLRPQTARHLERHARRSDMQRVRDGERYRLTLPPLAMQHQFAGWVLLIDGATVDVTRVPPPRRFGVLTREHLVAGQNRDIVLELLATPMWALTRPRSWSELPRALDALLARLDS